MKKLVVTVQNLNKFLICLIGIEASMVCVQNKKWLVWTQQRDTVDNHLLNSAEHYILVMPSRFNFSSVSDKL